MRSNQEFCAEINARKDIILKKKKERRRVLVICCSFFICATLVVGTHITRPFSISREEEQEFLPNNEQIKNEQSEEYADAEQSESQNKNSYNEIENTNDPLIGEGLISEVGDGPGVSEDETEKDTEHPRLDAGEDPYPYYPFSITMHPKLEAGEDPYPYYPQNGNN